MNTVHPTDDELFDSGLGKHLIRSRLGADAILNIMQKINRNKSETMN